MKNYMHFALDLHLYDKHTSVQKNWDTRFFLLKEKNLFGVG